MASATVVRPLHWKSISLRGLMLLILLLAVWLAWETNRARRQKRALAIMEALRFAVTLDDRADEQGTIRRGLPLVRPRWQEWVVRHIGPDYIQRPRVLTARDSRSPFGTQTELPPEFWDALADMPGLVKLDLSETDADDDHLAVLDDLRELKHLDLSHCPNIRGAGLVHLGSLQDLRSLDLSFTSVTDEGLSHLAGLGNLETLYLRETRITSAGLAHLRTMSRLKRLDLRETAVGDQGLEHLGHLSSLDSLSLADTRISDAGLASLRALPSLTYLGVRKTAISDDCLPLLRSFPKLSAIDTSETRVTLPVWKELKTRRRRATILP